MTIQEILAVAKLKRIDTEVLLSVILGVDKSFLLTHPEHVLTEGQLEKWTNYYTRAQKGEPIAYVLGYREFYGRNFEVDSRVLIPRPETEELVIRAVEFLHCSERLNVPLSVLDVGIGSGAVLLSIVLELQSSDTPISEGAFIGVDISVDALEIAQANAEKHHLAQIVQLVQSDLLEAVQGSKFDCVVANLPYISHAESLGNKFEPQLALDGGVAGTELNNKLNNQISAVMKPGGLFLYEGYGGQIFQKNC